MQGVLAVRPDPYRFRLEAVFAFVGWRQFLPRLHRSSLPAKKFPATKQTCNMGPQPKACAMDSFTKFMTEIQPARSAPGKAMLPKEAGKPVLWRPMDGISEYPETVQAMEELAGRIHSENAAEEVWLVEHPALYTAGTSAQATDLLSPDRFPVFKSGRGGQYTYHGPGQRVAYVMLDLKRRKQDVRAFVAALEEWVIATLDEFNIKGERRQDRVGVWVARPDKARLPDGSVREDKIAAIGVRLRRWVSFHGIAINVEPELEHFSGIVPCGVAGHGVTSLVDLGLPVKMADLDDALKRNFEKLLGPVG